MSSEVAHVGELANQYKPRYHQSILHENTARFKVLNVHRRFGKSEYAVMECIYQCLRLRAPPYNHPNPQALYIGPLRNQVKNIVWDLLKARCYELGLTGYPDFEKNEQDLFVKFNGCTIRLLGADKPDTARGLRADFAVFDEYADMKPEMYNKIIRPALADCKGSAIFLSTPQGKNHFFDIYARAEQEAQKGNPDWNAYTWTVEQTVNYYQENYINKGLPLPDDRIIDLEELENLKTDMEEASFEQEMLCSFEAAISGAYYGKQITNAKAQGRVYGHDIYNPGYPIYTGWDLGIDDLTVIWLYQMIRGELYWIDCIADNEKPLITYVQELQMLANANDYVYRDAWVPPDIKQRKDEGSQIGTRFKTLKRLGVKARITPNLPVVERINIARMMFPKMHFSRQVSVPKTKGATTPLDILARYRIEKSPHSNSMMRIPKREHWVSDYADAFSYGCVGARKILDNNRVYRTRDEKLIAPAGFEHEHDEMIGFHYQGRKTHYTPTPHLNRSRHQRFQHARRLGR